MPTNRESFLRRFFNSSLFLFSAIIVATLVIFSFCRTYYQEYQTKQEMARLQEDIDGLKVKKLELLEKLKYVQSQAFIERAARSELNMSKAGEKVLVFASSNTADNIGQPLDNVVVSKDEPNYLKWWRYFMGGE